MVTPVAVKIHFEHAITGGEVVFSSRGCTTGGATATGPRMCVLVEHCAEDVDNCFRIRMAKMHDNLLHGARLVGASERWAGLMADARSARRRSAVWLAQSGYVASRRGGAARLAAVEPPNVKCSRPSDRSDKAS